MADLQHLWPPFREKVLALLADRAAMEIGVYVVSGYRSVELQAALYADALRRYGTAHEARKWVAPPGKSNHGPKVDDDGHEPGPWGRAVDLGVPGIPAVNGKWPADIKQAVATLADRYEMFSPLQWEDWHHEPKPSMYLRPHPPLVTPQPLEVESMAMVVIDRKTSPDPSGRLPNWETDDAGNIFNWNGARFLKPLSAFDSRFAGHDHPNIVGIAEEPGGDGIVLFADDTRQEPDGAWVRSTYKITVGM